jgi:hypothetical protein
MAVEGGLHLGDGEPEQGLLATEIRRSQNRVRGVPRVPAMRLEWTEERDDRHVKRSRDVQQACVDAERQVDPAEKRVHVADGEFATPVTHVRVQRGGHARENVGVVAGVAGRVAKMNLAIPLGD